MIRPQLLELLPSTGLIFIVFFKLEKDMVQCLWICNQAVHLSKKIPPLKLCIEMGTIP